MERRLEGEMGWSLAEPEPTWHRCWGRGRKGRDRREEEKRVQGQEGGGKKRRKGRGRRGRKMKASRSPGEQRSP